MAQDKRYTRVQQKIDTTANWNKATNFRPLEGEVVIYQDAGDTVPKIKIGHADTLVSDLPFITEDIEADVDALKEASLNSISLYTQSGAELYGEVISVENNGTNNFATNGKFRATDSNYYHQFYLNSNITAHRPEISGGIPYRVQVSESNDRSRGVKLINGNWYFFILDNLNQTIDFINFNIESAIKATQDGNGNNIVNTYATKTALTEATTDLVYYSEEERETAVVPLDADTLGSQPPSYYATAEAVSNAQSTADTAKSTAENVQTVANNAMPIAGGTFTARVGYPTDSAKTVFNDKYSFRNIAIFNSAGNTAQSSGNIRMLRK